MLALAVLTSVGVWAVQSSSATHVVRVGWLEVGYLDVPARVVDVGSGGHPTLELDFQHIRLERWDDVALEGSVVFRDGRPVGRASTVNMAPAGLLSGLLTGETVRRTRVVVGPLPDVEAKLESSGSATTAPSEWTAVQGTARLRIGDPVWLLNAWGDVARGVPAVVLACDDERLALGSVGGLDPHPADTELLVATVEHDPHGVFGWPEPVHVGEFVGGVVAADAEPWIAIRRAMPRGVLVDVVADGLGADRTRCRYRVGRLRSRLPPLDGLREALLACGIDESHYYTPLRVEVVLDSDDPVELRAEASALGSSAVDALRRVQRYLSDVRGGKPPQTIRITVSGTE